MTLSAIKAVPHFPEPETPEPDSFSDGSAAEPDQWHELPCHLDAASGQAEQQRIDDDQASLHEQLAILVQALSSDAVHEPESETEAYTGEHALADEVESDPSGQSADENHLWLSKTASTLLTAFRDMPTWRFRGFIAGFGASVLAGGLLLVLGNGISEPVADDRAMHDDPQVVAAASSAAGETLMVPLRESILTEIEQGPTIGTDESQLGASKASPEDMERMADDTGSMAEPSIEDDMSRDVAPTPVQAFSDTTDSIPSVADSRPDQETSGVAMSFETTVQPAPEEDKSSLAMNPAEVTTGEFGAETAQTLHVTRDVNMRSGPDNGAPVLAIVPEGSPVEVVHCDQWCEVISAGQRGWIYKDFLSGASADELSPARSSS